MPAALPLIAGAFLAAGSIATAIGLGTALVVAGLAISWAAVLTITGVALLAVSYLARKTPKPESSGQQLQQKLDPQAPVPIAYGRTASGGYITWRGTWGAKNAMYGIVTVLSAGGPIAAIEAYRAGDYPIGWSGSPAVQLATAATVGGYDAGSKLYKGKVRQRWQVGEAPASNTPGGATGYPIPAGKMSGLAHAITSYEYSTDAFPQGLPTSVWTLRGVKLYDPRKDSTYPGGLGAHRLATPLTWEYSENPFLAALQWTLGRYENGRRVYGIGAKWEEVDVASFVNAANVADANNWKIGGIVTTGDDKYAVLASILAAGGGTPIARGAQIAVTVNAPKSTIFTITRSDIIGDVEISTTTSWRDRQNTIIPRYREESQNWEIVSGEQVSSATYIDEDGGEKKTVEIEFPLVQQAAQAHQLATYELANSREFLTFTLQAKMRLLSVRVGDAVTVAVPEIASGNTKCIVAGREFNPADLTVTLTLKSETDAKHAFALGQSQVAPPAPTLDGYDPSAPIAPAANAWAVTATQITNGTTTLPVIVVSGAVDDPNASAVVVEYRPSGSSTWLAAGEHPHATTRLEISGLTDGTAYEIALSYRTVRDVVGARLVLSATAGALTVNWASVGGTGKPQDNATRNVVRGDWTTGTSYAVGDVVYYAGSSYAVLTAHVSSTPPPGANYQLFASQGVTGVTGAAGSQGPVGPAGATLYTWIAYANDINGGSGFTTGAPSGQSYIGIANNKLSAEESQIASDYTWSLIKGTDGVPGTQGPQGEKTYTWFAYASSADGSADFTTGAPQAYHSYLGLAANKTTATESGDYHDYAWSLIKGPQGVPGIQGLPGNTGANGQTSYVHFAYANSITGIVDFTTGVPDNRAYEGSYTDFTATDSNDPAAYTWREYRGPAFGLAGDGVSIAGNQIIKLAPDGWDAQAYSTISYTAGAIASFRGVGNSTDVFMAGLNSDPSTNASYDSIDHAWYLRGDRHAEVWVNGSGTGITTGQHYGLGLFQVSYDNKFVRYLYNGDVYHSVDVGPGKVFYFDSSLYVTGQRITDIAFSAAAARGNDGLQGNQGLPGSTGASGQTSYVHIAYANSADGAADFTTGAAGGRLYIGVYTDFSAADSSDYHNYTWSRWRGADGDQGIQGAPGANGLPSYTHFAYADSADGSVAFHTSDPTGRGYLGVYTDSTAADSGDYTAYTWSKIKGEAGAPGLQGVQGIPGSTGANGQTSYVHIAYADSADGSYNFTNGAAGGRAYIGVYTDFVSADSGDYHSYTWSRWRGQDGATGVPGTAGNNGQTPYTHFAYANSADGSSNFHVSDPIGRTYLGVYTDFIEADSGDYQSYTWSLIKGADGADGAAGDPATVVTASPSSLTFLADYQGTIKAGNDQQSVTATMMRGSTDVSASATWEVTSAINASCQFAKDGRASNVATIYNVATQGYVDLKGTYAGVSQVSRITWVVTKDAPPPASQTSGGGNINYTLSSTVFDQVASTLTLRSSASGTLSVSLSADYYVVAGKTNRTFNAAATVAWAIPGQPWNYPSQSQGVASISYANGDVEPGSVNFSATITGLSPDTAYDLAPMMRKSLGTGTSASVYGQYAVSQ